MEPDTFNYMAAGFSVIFLGIGGYIISLVSRTLYVNKKIKRLKN